MKVVFVSNCFNHHQSALSDALWRETGGGFCFVQTESLTLEQQLLGYPRLEREYVLHWKEDPEGVKKKLREADVILAGSAPEGLIRPQILAGKLVFRYWERPMKAREGWKTLPRWIRWHWRNPKSRQVYLLCASGYTAGDCASVGLFPDRRFRWGYFPETKKQDQKVLMENKDPTALLWAGRMIPCKQPQAAIDTAAKLRDAGVDFHLTMIGRGPLEADLKQQTAELGLSDWVHFPGAMPVEAVRKEMEKAGIFLMTSSREEGWGVVINEAMNSGCAVIASHMAGAVPFLLRHGENALVYPDGEGKGLYEAAAQLLQQPWEQKRLGMAACDTIENLWNETIAARRLLILSRQILDGKQDLSLFAHGPCSPAEVIREDWFV